MCRRTEFALGAVRDAQALERIRADLCQIRGVSVTDIDLRTGSIRIECEEDHATHAALNAANRSLEELPGPPCTANDVERPAPDRDSRPPPTRHRSPAGRPVRRTSTDGPRASMIEASGGGARER